MECPSHIDNVITASYLAGIVGRDNKIGMEPHSHTSNFIITASSLDSTQVRLDNKSSQFIVHLLYTVIYTTVHYLQQICVS